MRTEHIQELMLITAHDNNEDEDTEQIPAGKTTREIDGETYSINMQSTQRFYKVNNILGYKAAGNLVNRADIFNHIGREFLQAPINSMIDIYLWDENITTLRKLRQYLRKPGLDEMQWRDMTDKDK